MKCTIFILFSVISIFLHVLNFHYMYHCSPPVFKIFALACDLKVRNASINLSLWLDDIFICGVSSIKRACEIPVSYGSYCNFFSKQKNKCLCPIYPNYWLLMFGISKERKLIKRQMFIFYFIFFPVRLYAVNLFSYNCIHTTCWKWMFIFL